MTSPNAEPSATTGDHTSSCPFAGASAPPCAPLAALLSVPLLFLQAPARSVNFRAPTDPRTARSGAACEADCAVAGAPRAATVLPGHMPTPGKTPLLYHPEWPMNRYARMSTQRLSRRCKLSRAMRTQACAKAAQQGRKTHPKRNSNRIYLWRGMSDILPSVKFWTTHE